ncbi:MAG TPA: NAD-glutamate dehydrogenase domain-containing protein [Acidimicrobiales bacterium]|nr:NAD-glutamate dehydrogenase domain-containing protein [Acidimicrobiales bacterium]
MSEGTGEAQPAGDDTLAGAADAALAPILGRVAASSGPRGALVAQFARAVLRRVPGAQLGGADPAAVAGAVAGSFAFVDGRAPGEIKVRVVDPEVALDGARPAGTVIEVSCDDRPFIVTTVIGELQRLGHKVVRALHPVYGSERDETGRLAAILPARPAVHRESFLQAEVGGRMEAGARAAVVDALHAVLEDVFAATGDYPAMREELCAVMTGIRQDAREAFPADEVDEVADLLEWLLDGNFVLAGCCRFPPEGGVTGALGVLARPEAPLRRSPPVRAGELLRVVRSAEISRVHRQVPMHCLDVADAGPSGAAGGVFRIVGVFTAKANAEPASVTPVLRFKLRRILELEDVVERSQDEMALVSLFQVLPKDELFEADVAGLRTLLVGLLAAEDQHDVRVMVRADAANGTVTALVSVPAELYDPGLRHRMEQYLLAATGGGRVDADVALGDRPEAILRIVVYADGSVADLQPDVLERELRLLSRTWDQQLAGALERVAGDVAGRRLASTWSDWFPSGYRQAVTADDAVDDVLHLDALLGARAGEPTDRIRIALAPDPAGGPHARLKVFTAEGGVELSRFLPIVESLGLWAVEDRPWVLGGEDGPVHLHDFGVTDPSGAAIDVATHGPRLAAAALALWQGRAEVDVLNRLVLHAGLPWDDVAVLRAYRRYRSQVGTTFTTSYVDEVLVEHAPAAAALLDLFAAMFDPVRDAGPEVIAELRRRVLDGCDAVARLDHDRILRGFLALVDATLRTNHYLAASEYIVLKFDSAAVPGMPRPVPYREVFVHGPAVEGIHLRGGPVARGGIRWSERPDDYRSEVLDLMQTQVLKNALIVPTGAKGGFVVKRPAYGAGNALSVAQAYEIFVSGLLEVTDNVVGDEVAAVPRRRDGDDTYLVVAADRGTASFSDLANRVSRERGFWLDDAFASGSSTGYDHKRLGITARGAWVAVRHHFSELDIDVQSEAITVVGIGDMSGDVFGNAMLRSPHIRLVAAFDHRHVFIDPDPDPAVTYQERARIFALPASSWADYDRTLLSPGGGVWSRLEKKITLGDEARAALRVDEAELTPAEVIRAILQAPVALLFTGGIGTFVRASTEPDHEIDDRLNADVRVEGSSVRARVVGEGANLAFTQRARIEYARRGGHINTDAIDNAAGVDTSDHEVNVKILLRLAVEAGELTMAERDRVLEEVGPDVTAAVLADCGRQNVALSRAQALSPARMVATEALIEELAADGIVDRSVEALPTTAEMEARHQAGAGLTRPELAVLLAGAKRSLSARLLASAMPDEPALRPALVSYFPPMLAARFGHLVDGHRLRRELVASVVANDLVDRMGATFVTRLAADTGARPPAVAAAYWIARGVVDAGRWWAEIDGDDSRSGVPGALAAGPPLSELLEALTRDYLRRGEAGDLSALDRDRPAVAELAAAIGDLGTPYRRRLRARRAEQLIDGGLQPDLAVRWATLPELEIGPDAADLARTTARPVPAVAEAILQLGESLGVDRLVERLRQVTPTDRWGRAAWRGLVDDLDDLRRWAAHRALADHPGQPAPDAVLLFLVERSRQVGEITRLLRDVEDEPRPSLDAVAVATRAVRRAIG